MLSHSGLLLGKKVYILTYIKGHYHLSETKIKYHMLLSSIFFFTNECLLLQIFIQSQLVIFLNFIFN